MIGDVAARHMLPSFLEGSCYPSLSRGLSHGRASGRVQGRSSWCLLQQDEELEGFDVRAMAVMRRMLFDCSLCGLWIGSWD